MKKRNAKSERKESGETIVKEIRRKDNSPLFVPRNNDYVKQQISMIANFREFTPCDSSVLNFTEAPR